MTLSEAISYVSTGKYEMTKPDWNDYIRKYDKRLVWSRSVEIGKPWEATYLCKAAFDEDWEVREIDNEKQS